MQFELYEPFCSVAATFWRFDVNQTSIFLHLPLNIPLDKKCDFLYNLSTGKNHFYGILESIYMGDVMEVKKEKKRSKKKIMTIALFVLIALAAILCYLLNRNEKIEILHGYVASDTANVVIFDASGEEVETIARGSTVDYARLPDVKGTDGKKEPAQQYALYTQDSNGKWSAQDRFIRTKHVVADLADVVITEKLYVRTPTNLTDVTGVHLGALVTRGQSLSVIGYDGLQEDGSISRYHVTTDSGENGYILPDRYAFVSQIDDAVQHDPKTYAIHVERGDSYGGGDAADLDYFPREKCQFDENKMPDVVNAFYMSSEVLSLVDEYIQVARGSRFNAFVVDILDGGVVGYASPVLQKYCPSTQGCAQNTMEEYKNCIQKLKDAGFYVIGRMTTFNDPYLAADHPEKTISDLSGNPMRISGMYWPTPYDREVWEYKVDLAVEAATEMGFHEIQFDYVRFPDGTWTADQNGSIDYHNRNGESKAQAIERFLMYACDRLHAMNVYVAADVFGECANDYVTAYGQYWPAISQVVDVISAMPYPDHYGASGSYLPWEHPYETLYGFASSAVKRQEETNSPAVVRTWIQAYNAIREPYTVYGPTEMIAQANALTDAGCTGGIITWNAASSLSKYAALARQY